MGGKNPHYFNPNPQTQMNDTPKTSALAERTKPAGIRDLLTGPLFKEQLALALPRHLSPERFIRIALTAMSRTPKLMECTKESFFKCLLDLSAMGLEPDGRRAHLIPYNNRKNQTVECQLIVDYKGLVELAKRGGGVQLWRAELVCEKDEFEWRDGSVTHGINWRQDRGQAQCVYSAVRTPDGTNDFEVMTLAEVNAIRRRSRSADDGPWVTDFNEMAKKSVMRRHSKRLTLSPEFHDAVARDDDRLELPVSGRVVAPDFTSLPAPAAEEADHIPMDDAPPASPPQPLPAPAPRTRKPREPKPEPPLKLETEGPLTQRETLAAKISAAGLDRGKVAQWVEDSSLPPLEIMNEAEAASVLGEWERIKEACR